MDVVSYVYDVGAQSEAAYGNIFRQYILEFHEQQILDLLTAVDVSLHYSIVVSVLDLLDYNQELATLLLQHPNKLLPVMDEVLLEAQEELMRLRQAEAVVPMSVKRLCHARFHMFPTTKEVTKHSISSIRSSDVGQMIHLSGTVIRTGIVKMLEGTREYECQKCGHRWIVKSDLEQQNTIEVPKSCPAPGRKKCKSTSFRLVEDGGNTQCLDYQEIKVQEQVQRLSVGSVPRSIMVVLQNDLVDRVQAGDDVVVHGVVRRMWAPVIRDERCELELFIEANYVTVQNDTKATITVTEDNKKLFEASWRMNQHQPLIMRNFIVKSICPQLYGLFVVKLAVALTLIGGVPKVDESGTKVRGESHLMIVGDPGTGKSQLLRYAAKVSSRAVLTTGIGTTSAGLTVMAGKDSSGEWALEAGALVLADGGVCCIDEFGCVREADRTTIHEAMEQQTLSIAKAGLVCTLNTRTTVFAVLNPKGAYDNDAELSVNTAIAPPLLSRFDIILLMLDTQNEEWDRKVTSYIMDALDKPSYEDIVNVDCEEEKEKKEDEAPPWNISMMQAYIYYVKKNFQPYLTNFSQQILIKYYQFQRQADSRSMARTTVRLLESLIRLAQAHARLMFRPVVLPQDAIMAVIMCESSVSTSSLLGGGSALHMMFSESPEEEYQRQEAIILQRLGLGDPPPNERSWDYEAYLTSASASTAATSSSSPYHTGAGGSEGFFSASEGLYPISGGTDVTSQNQYVQGQGEGQGRVEGQLNSNEDLEAWFSGQVEGSENDSPAVVQGSEAEMKVKQRSNHDAPDDDGRGMPASQSIPDEQLQGSENNLELTQPQQLPQSQQQRQLPHKLRPSQSSQQLSPSPDLPQCMQTPPSSGEHASQVFDESESNDSQPVQSASQPASTSASAFVSAAILSSQKSRDGASSSTSIPLSQQHNVPSISAASSVTQQPPKSSSSFFHQAPISKANLPYSTSFNTPLDMFEDDISLLDADNVLGADILLSFPAPASTSMSSSLLSGHMLGSAKPSSFLGSFSQPSTLKSSGGAVPPRPFSPVDDLDPFA